MPCYFPMYDKLQYTREQSQMLKGVAILFMICFHLFAPNPASPQNGLSFSYTGIDAVIGHFCDRTVPLYIFMTGYSLYICAIPSVKEVLTQKVIPLYRQMWILALIFLPILFLLGKIEWSLGRFLHTIIIGDGYIRIWWYVGFYALLMTIVSVAYAICNKVRGKIIHILIPVTVVALLLYFLVDDKYNMPFLINRFVKFTVYLLLGYWVARYRMLSYYRRNVVVSVVLLAIIVGLNNLPMHDFLYRLYRLLSFPLMVACFIDIIDRRGMRNTFQYLGHHSTNIWLIHGFFFYFFYQYVYMPKYWLLILVSFTVVNIACSLGYNHLIGNVFTSKRHNNK